MKTGIYTDVDEKAYHSDPCDAPSLSSSIIKILDKESPGHAWWEHPKLRPGKALELEQSTKTQGMGTVLHKLILGKGRAIKVLNFDDFRTNAAKAGRDAAIERGETPILAKKMEEAEEVAEAVRPRIAASRVGHLIGPDLGDAEVTGIWQESNGIWCRMRLDWLPTVARDGGHITVIDLKTTEQSANAADWQRTMFDFGGDIQSAFYSRGLRKLIPGVRSVDFVFVVVEQNPPNAVSLCRVSGETEEMASETVDAAIKTWGACLARGTALEHWPFYEDEITAIDPPIYRKTAAEMRRMRMLNRLAEWQRPTATAAE
jgi:hypothetical protein